MNSNFARGLCMLLLAGLVTGVCGPLRAAEINVSRTNWTERYITNSIDIYMPKNVFVNEYHTNWVEKFHTNVVHHYATNVFTRTITNTVLFRFTNQVAVDLLHTNFVERYRTNWTTLTLTNWRTVLVMRTNWVTQPVTNLVQLDMSPNGPVAATSEPARPVVTPVSALSRAPLPPAPISNDISLEGYRTGRPIINNAVEVLLKVRWTGPVASALLVQQWRVESEDGTVLVQSQDKDFRRDLPFGRYKVEVRVRRETGGPLMAARGTLSVTPRDAYVLQKVAAD